MNNHTNITDIRKPPFSIDSEQALLGGLLIDNDGFDRLGKLQPADFYELRHQAIFAAIQELAQAGRQFDPVLVSEHLEGGGITMTGVNWLPYLGQLARETPSAHNVGAYARVVSRFAYLRRVIVGAAQVQDAAYRNGPLEQRIADVEHSLMRFSDVGNDPGFKPIKSILTSAVDQIEARFMRGDVPIGAQTGIEELDELVIGFEPGDLVVLAARPSMGKTGFALRCVNECAQRGGTVGMFSLEMSDLQLVSRLLSALSGVSLTKYRTGHFDDDDWPKVTSAINALQNKGIEIDDSSSVTPGEIGARARRLARKCGGLSLLVIDYLQLIETNGKGTGAEQIGQITRTLKALAKELKVPVLLLSQLNRELERRSVNDRRPVPADLRGSGDIEQDADIILFLYREVVYIPDTPEPDLCEVIVAKNRNGPLGSARCRFRDQIAWFDIMSEHDPYGAGFGGDHDYSSVADARAAQQHVLPELD